MKIYSSAQMRMADKEAIDDCKIDGLILMENAAMAIENAVCEYADGRSLSVLAICGRGNNGGDGFAAARRLMQDRLKVTAAFFGAEAEMTPDCRRNFEIYKNVGGKIIDAAELFKAQANSFDVIIDALYGFGFHGELCGRDREIAELVNSSGAYVIAADVPSGVCADSGECAFAIRADKTVTFTGLKPSHLQFEAAELCGEITVRDIGIPKYIQDKYGIGETVEAELVQRLLTPRKRNAHKGSCGKIFVLGGSRGMSGAVCMSARAAMRSGAGLVTAGVPSGINGIFEQKVTEAMSVALSEDENGALDASVCGDVLEYAKNNDVLIIGPGMGRGNGAKNVVRECIKNYTGRLIIDADALYALSEDMSVLENSRADIVITPHYAEMARLTGYDTKYIERNSIECARELGEKYNVTVVLKGAYTVTAGKEKIYVNNEVGNAGMATGGSGDVLSGIIGAILCRTDDTVDAAACAVYIHALAGDMAKKHFGEEAMCAEDIIEALGDAFREIGK